MDYDFCGWATKCNVKCSDGRTILPDAFKHNDGATVPLIWNHRHDDPNAVLGHAVLENRRDGVYAYGYFNDSEAAQAAKSAVKHGDVVSMSIYANKLKEKMGSVFHGDIKELSLVLAGANPKASIQSVMVHGELSDDEAMIFFDEPLELSHAEAEEENEMADSTKTIGEIVATMNDEQRDALYALVGLAVEQAKGAEVSHSDLDDYSIDDISDFLQHNEEDFDMYNNAFYPEEAYEDAGTLTHSDMAVIIDDAKRNGSLRESVLSHADDYGIEQIDWLFPEATNLNNPPEFIKRETGWVSKVMNGVHHTPFSRIKSVFANITEDEARAKGYIKGKMKKEEVFTLLKRSTTPTTIYKKQKLDRDDKIDITDFDVVAWIKTEMRMMLDEEIARAILIGDGRNTADDDHIKADCIRPIAFDEDLFTIKKNVTVSSTATDQDKAKATIKAIIKARKDYKGSGEPTFYTTEDILTDMLLIEDAMGHLMYDSVSKLCNVLRVKDIVTVPVMENVTTSDGKPLIGIVVNLTDYNVGADKGGSINMFEDFDIDYNQEKYLIETRCSGALVKPYSAIAVALETSAG